MSSYNGWKNWETWSVSLWISNDEQFYNTALLCGTYFQWVELMAEESIFNNQDGVDFKDSSLDVESLNEFIKNLK